MIPRARIPHLGRDLIKGERLLYLHRKVNLIKSCDEIYEEGYEFLDSMRYSISINIRHVHIDFLFFIFSSMLC